jgi:hypothetical protein
MEGPLWSRRVSSWPFTSVFVATNRQRSDGKPTDVRRDRPGASRMSVAATRSARSITASSNSRCGRNTEPCGITPLLLATIEVTCWPGTSQRPNSTGSLLRRQGRSGHPGRAGGPPLEVSHHRIIFGSTEQMRAGGRVLSGADGNCSRGITPLLAECDLHALGSCHLGSSSPAA